MLTLYFTEDQMRKAAQGQIRKIQNKLLAYRLQCDRIEFKTGAVPKLSQALASRKKLGSGGKKSVGKVANPLQALCLDHPNIHLENSSYLVLEAATQAEATCNPIYQKLRKRTHVLVEPDGVTFPVSFNWRLRVGGTRGFLDLLLPVFHPIFGIPYVPASSLKGAARAWARREGDPKIQQLLGMLKGKTALAAKVEFLDAFPTAPCLSVDVATPQWHWLAHKVIYKPEPHPLLSMERPKLLIGLRPTVRGSASDVQDVKGWLEHALSNGIGSRVSSGYGRALGSLVSSSNYPRHDFELWTQGMYGSDPPTKENNYRGSSEFRPTAIRGILRYWFRAVALSLYEPEVCQSLESEIFGQLSKQGNLSINVVFNSALRENPDLYTGKIILEAAKPEVLTLANYLLRLASSLGGLGRGSRRPLHLLNGRMRGCHWSINSLEMPTAYGLEPWKLLFTHLTDAFEAIRSPVNSHTVNPGEPGNRRQDVLDKNAQVWLVKSPHQIHPEQVKDWRKDGDALEVRGTALNLLYGDERFKGEAKKDREKVGNAHVGGALETPSYVWIKSIFPQEDIPYQVVTIFGANDHNRFLFAKELQKLKNQGNAELVLGKMPTEEQARRPKQSKPKRK